MRQRLLRFFDIRPGEALPLLFTFLYVAVAVASFLLAKPIRNGLFLDQFGANRLVYVYVCVPLVLTAFVPVYTRLASLRGQRAVITGSLLFFLLNVLAFWYGFTYYRWPWLSAAFFIWVNCYGIIAPVQAWTFANSVFDTRQAKRLFGLVGSGASLGAILGGALAGTLVGPLGGSVNLLLVLAALIAFAAIIVNVAWRVRRPEGMPGCRVRVPFRRTLGAIRRTPYLALIAALVVLVAITTQWTQFLFSVMAESRFEGDADRLTQFFGRFNFYMGVVAFSLQLLLTGPALRRFGIAFTILLLPASLGAGAMFIVLFPSLWAVMLTNAFDQSLRFSVDKATFELLYLPVPSSVRTNVKATIDLIVNRLGDGIGGILLGVATAGFSFVFFRLPGLHLGARGIAAIVLCLTGVWIAVALALRRGYVDAIRDSIQQHRLDPVRGERTLDRSATELLAARLSSDRESEVVYALDLFASQFPRTTHPALHALVGHPSAAVRQRAVAMLNAAGDRAVRAQVERLIADPDLGVRTEALLYLTRHAGIDPLARIESLGDFPDFSIRAGMVAFLSRPGREQNLEAARLILDRMVAETGPDGRRARLEAARLLGYLPREFWPEVERLLNDRDPEVVREALEATGRRQDVGLARAVIVLLGRPEFRDAAAAALTALGDPVVPQLRAALVDPALGDAARFEVPAVLARIATGPAQKVLVDNLLLGGTELRARIITALADLHQRRPDLPVDRQLVETVLAAEIMGHYRSYQILGSLGTALEGDDPIEVALGRSMDQEVERIFRLTSVLSTGSDLQTAWEGLRSESAGVRANALELLDNVLAPQLRALLVPLVDPAVSLDERIALSRRVVGTTVETHDEAVLTLVHSDQPWLRSSAAYAIGMLRLHHLEAELTRLSTDPDPLVRETARAAANQLSGLPAQPAAVAEAPVEAPTWTDARDAIGVG